jgi:hypothetical protein
LVLGGTAPYGYAPKRGKTSRKKGHALSDYNIFVKAEWEENNAHYKKIGPKAAMAKIASKWKKM